MRGATGGVHVLRQARGGGGGVGLCAMLGRCGRWGLLGLARLTRPHGLLLTGLAWLLTTIIVSWLARHNWHHTRTRHYHPHHVRLAMWLAWVHGLVLRRVASCCCCHELVLVARHWTSQYGMPSHLEGGGKVWSGTSSIATVLVTLSSWSS